MVGRLDIGGFSEQASIQEDRVPVNKEVTAALVEAIAQKVRQSEDKEYLPIEKAKHVTASMNKFLEGSTSRVRFEFHEKLNEYYVTIVDPDTKEVVKEIPPKRLMDAFAAMRDFVGMFVDRKI